MLSSFALKAKPSHAKFLFEKVKSLELSEHCKFTLLLLKHVNKNACKGPMSDQAAHEAGFGRSKIGGNKGYKEFDDLLFSEGIDGINLNKRNSKKTRSFSLGGEEKESSPKNQKKRHNSPVAGRGTRDHCKDIVVTSLDELREIGTKRRTSGSNLRPARMEESKHEETKQPPLRKLEDDKQSTDEEDPFKAEKKKLSYLDIDQKVQNLFWGVDDNATPKKQNETVPKKQEETKEVVEELSPREKAIKEELKEESLEMLWSLSQESVVSQGVNYSVHKGAIDAFAFALSYCSNEVKWRYVVKMMDRLQQNDSITSV